MRILLLTQYYYPSTKSTAKLMYDLSLELARQGAQVLVVTPSEQVAGRYEVSEENGITVLRVRSPSLGSVSTRRRAIAEIRMVARIALGARSFFKRNPCDMVVWWTPSLFFTFVVRVLRRMWQCRTYLLVRDVVPQWWVDCGLMRAGSMVHRLLSMVERRQYAIADVIGVQSPSNLAYFSGFSPSLVHRTEVLWNWAAIPEISLAASRIRDDLGLRKKTVFFYGGNMGIAQDMDNIVRLAASLVEEGEIRFLLVGEGSERPRLERLIGELALPNITIRPAVDQDTYIAMVSEFDVGLVSLDRRHQTHNFPGKMLGYFGCGKPVIASINPGNDLKEVLESAEAGLVSLNGDDSLLREHTLMLARSPVLRRKMGANGRRLMDELFTVTRAAAQIIAHGQRPA